jgi:hypothetical protein
MNTLKAITVGIALLASFSALAEIRPEEGNERGNGGDEFSKEFVRTAYDVYESLAKDPIAGVDNRALLAAIQRTKVNSRESLVLRGNQVDAINYPDANDPRILISRSGWLRMKNAKHRRAFLALHEYLGIMGVDDSAYQVSIQLDRAGVCERNAVIRHGIENTVKKFCYRITAEDLHFIDPILSFGNWTENSEGSDLRESDLAGLNRLTTFSFYAPIARLHADVFDSVSNLNFVSLHAPARIDRLNVHSSIGALSINGDFERGFSAQNIEDAAFSQLPQLRFLSIYLDASRVKMTRALAGISKLNQLNLYLLNAAKVPLDFISIVKQNPGLSRFSLGIYKGKIGEAHDQLLALGFRCQDFSRSLPGGEMISCER